MADSHNPEIEDVLASIRRLVSEDVTGGGPRKRASRRLSHAGPGGEALVLTPDFRVVEKAEAEAVPADAEDGPEVQVPEGMDPDAPYDLASIEETIQDLEAAIGAGEDSVGTPWEADGSEAEAWGAEAPAAPAAEDASEPEAPEVGAPERIEDPEPELAEGRPDAVADKPDDAAVAFADEPHAEARGRIDPDAEEAVIVEDPAPDVPEAAEGDEPVEAVIEEETLRAIVAEVLREELQGALGERITRNVRKLVRREINQLLAAREFD